MYLLTSVCCQDASLLLDLCRQCIIFEDVADIAVCLREISTDLDVHIVRVKNRLDPRFDAAISAGYRDVVLNLRIANEQTAAMGTDWHVCEVQLIHTRFAELKVRNCQFILQWRNCQFVLSIHLMP